MAGSILVLVGCGSGTTAGLSPAPPASQPPSISTPPPIVRQAETGEAGRTPDRVAQPAVKPAPRGVEPPAPKPARPGKPTPPPDRTVADPAVAAPAPPEPADYPASLHPADQRVGAAIADLASRLGVERGVIELLDARRVTWRDGSVGCPEPGIAYSHALVPGSLVVLRIEDSSFRYHAAGDALPFYCPSPEAPLEGGA